MPDRVGDDLATELSGTGVVNTVRARQWARGHAPLRDDHPGAATDGAMSNRHAAYRMRIEPGVVPPRHITVAVRKH